MKLLYHATGKDPLKRVLFSPSKMGDYHTIHTKTISHRLTVAIQPTSDKETTMPGPATSGGKNIKVIKLGQTAGRDYGSNTTSKKSQKVRDLSAKR